MALVPNPHARGRPFQPGVSGNPGGRPRGSRNQRTLALEAMLDAAGEALLRKLIERALGGDVSALRTCSKILLPKGCKQRVEFPLPSLATVGDCLHAQAMVIEASSRGELSFDEGDALLRLIDRHRQSLLCAESEAKSRS